MQRRQEGCQIETAQTTAPHEEQLSELFRFGNLPVSFAPIVSLLVAVAAIMVVRRVFDIKRWHGPADAIYAAHRSDNELDVRSGFGSTLAAFI